LPLMPLTPPELGAGGDLPPFYTHSYTRNMEVFCPEAWGQDETARGYTYRGASFVFAYASTGIANIPPPRQPWPSSGTVVAYCYTHVRRLGPDAWAMEGRHFIGSLIIVREDGSTSHIQADRVEQ